MHKHLTWQRTESDDKKNMHRTPNEHSYKALWPHEGVAEKTKPSTGSKRLSTAAVFSVAIGSGWVLTEERGLRVSCEFSSLPARAPGRAGLFIFFFGAQKEV